MVRQKAKNIQKIKSKAFTNNYDDSQTFPSHLKCTLMQMGLQVEECWWKMDILILVMKSIETPSYGLAKIGKGLYTQDSFYALN